jgi:hypothetical protein
MRLSIVKPLLRRRFGGMRGISVTASRAATAGGIASVWWWSGVRVVLPPFWPRTRTVWVEMDVFVGARDGMMTGFDCVGAEGGMVLGLGSGAAVYSSFFSPGCFCGLVEGEGVDLAVRDRAPIFSEGLCGEEGETRKG